MSTRRRIIRGGGNVSIHRGSSAAALTKHPRPSPSHPCPHQAAHARLAPTHPATPHPAWGHPAITAHPSPAITPGETFLPFGHFYQSGRSAPRPGPNHPAPPHHESTIPHPGCTARSACGKHTALVRGPLTNTLTHPKVLHSHRRRGGAGLGGRATGRMATS